MARKVNTLHSLVNLRGRRHAVAPVQKVQPTMRVKTIRRLQRLHFECTGCGACCTGARGHHVELGRDEKEKIRAQLAVSREWFQRRYVARVDGQTEGIRLGDDGRCPFLEASGRCRVYAVRPLQCRTYPWWPELLQGRAAWQAEARRCEGMNRGPLVPLATIERALRLQSQSAAGSKKIGVTKK